MSVLYAILIVLGFLAILGIGFAAFCMAGGVPEATLLLLVLIPIAFGCYAGTSAIENANNEVSTEVVQMQTDVANEGGELTWHSTK